jgi:IS30 family transposase
MIKARVRANRLEVDPVAFKKRRVETVTDEALTMIQNRLHYRPRKQLEFKTPHEVFNA